MTTTTSRENFENVDYFDCTGKDDGLYPHPTDCTRFIICFNGRAADMACADCDPDNVQCLGEPYTKFDGTQTYCDWPSNSQCISDPPAEA